MMLMVKTRPGSGVQHASLGVSGKGSLDEAARIVRLALDGHGGADKFFDGREIGHADTARGGMLMAATRLTGTPGRAPIASCGFWMHRLTRRASPAGLVMVPFKATLGVSI